MSRAALRFLRAPLVGEIAVEVGLRIAEVIGRGNRLAVEVDDMAFRIHAVKRPRVLGLARHHHAGGNSLAGELHQFAVGAYLAHVTHLSVAVDVGVLPVAAPVVGAVVGRVRAHVAPGLEHRLGAIGRNARHHVEQGLANALGHGGWQRFAAGGVGPLIDPPADKTDGQDGHEDPGGPGLGEPSGGGEHKVPFRRGPIRGQSAVVRAGIVEAVLIPQARDRRRGMA